MGALENMIIYEDTSKLQIEVQMLIQSIPNRYIVTVTVFYNN